MAAKSSSRWIPVIVIVVLGTLLLLVKQCNSSSEEPITTTEKKTTTTTTNSNKNSKGLDRNPSAINYSKHARCRMDCRHISEAEVKDILKNGKINYNKSELGDNPDCKRKYAVEGVTKDQQKVRIIFAPCQSEVTVVTVIDVGKDWECNCD